MSDTILLIEDEPAIADTITCYRFSQPGRKGACSYFAPVKTMAITPGLRFDYKHRNHAGLIQGQQYVVFEPPYAWLLTFTTAKDRASQQQLEAFAKCAESFSRR